jgi:phospholipid-binding lipoprotein MlaA
MELKMNSHLFRAAILVSISLFTSFCYADTFVNRDIPSKYSKFSNKGSVTTTTSNASVVDSSDPLSGYNHAVYSFNQYFDKFTLKPIAIVYKAFFPSPIIKCVNNFFYNLSEIPTVINDLLQVNFYYAGYDTWRFAVNSTVGIAGIFDVATMVGLKKHTQDLGLTFAKWGYTQSSYFIIPFIGASTVRDAIAFPLNYGMTVYPYIRPLSIGYTIVSVDWVDQRAQLLDFEDVRKAAALDPYQFERNAYLQKRNADIQANNEPSAKKIGILYNASFK